MQTKPSRSTRLKQRSGFIVTCIAMVALGGCSDNEESTVAQDNNGPSSTEQTIRTVASHIGNNFGTNIDSMTTVAEGSTAVSGIIDSNLTGSDDNITAGRSNTGSTVQNDTIDSPEGGLARLLSDDPDTESNDEIASLLLPTLGIGGSGSMIQNGSQITIDPDEHSICEAWLGANYDADCPTLLNPLTVVLNTQSDDEGSVTYLYGGETVLSIEYAPMQGSYEFSLAGMKQVMQQAASTDSQVSVPQTMQGTVKLSTTITSNTPDAEAGTLTIAVTEPVMIIDSNENLDISLQNSTLLSMSSDATAGTASLAMNILGLQLNTLIDNDDGSNSTIGISLPAMTMNAEVSTAEDTLTLTDSGMGDRTFSVELDGVTVMQMSLAQFSAILAGNQGTLTFLDNFDFDINISDLSFFDDEAAPNASALISAQIPTDTILQEQNNGSTIVQSGGPLVVDYTLNDGATNPSGTVSVDAGQCFSDDENSDEPILLVACD